MNSTGFGEKSKRTDKYEVLKRVFLFGRVWSEKGQKVENIW